MNTETPTTTEPAHVQLPCTQCSHHAVDTYTENGVRYYCTHRAPERHPDWCDASSQPATAETMTVTIRDRSRENPWGSGFTNPYTRKVTISAFCPTCGGRRGEPRGLNQHEDGAHYWVQVWDNPCGHTDYYAAVAREADDLAATVSR